MSSFYRFFILASFLFLLSMCVAGQDLGSSNKLFGGKKKSAAPSKTAKKAPAKATTSAAKKKPAPAAKATAKKTAPPKTTKSGAASSKTTATAKPKTTPEKFTEFKDTVIKPGKGVTTQPKPVKKPETERQITAETANLFEDLIEEGNIARDNRNYLAAEAAYRRAISLKPRDSRAIYGLGNLYSDQQRWEKAETAYREALDIEPSSAIAHIALSYVLVQPVVAPELSARYAEAEKLARRAIQLAPSNALAFDQLGVALELRGLIGPETESAYRRAILLDSAFAPAYAHLGRLLRRRGMNEESERLYKDAVKRSEDVATKILVADVMQSEQRYAESEKLLKKALDDDPRNPSALLLYGRALTAQGKFADAERVLRRSLEISPDSVMANSLLGALYSRQGKFELAENALLQAVRFASKYERRLLSQNFEMVGDGYMKSDKREKAERAYRQAIDLDSERETLAGKLSRARFG